MYIPAIRWKRGEIDALRRLIERRQDSGVIPLLLVDNFRERKQAEKKRAIPDDPKRYIDDVAGDMLNIIGPSRKAFIDTRLFDAERTAIDGLSTFFQNMTASLSAFVPVVRLSDSEQRRTVLATRAGIVGAGLCLRLGEIKRKKHIEQILQDLRVGTSDVDIIINLGVVAKGTHNVRKILNALTTLGSQGPWRSVTLLGGSYPKKLPVKPLHPLTYERHEWLLYKRVANANVANVSCPNFGDYGIMHPEAEPTSGSGAGGGTWPIIRYCSGDSWIIYKAMEPIDIRGISTYYKLARSCATDGTFMGGSFSHGDGYIRDRALAIDGCGGGNSTLYVATDTNHHLAFAATQLCGRMPKANPIPAAEAREPAAPVRQDELDDYWDE